MRCLLILLLLGGCATTRCPSKMVCTKYEGNNNLIWNEGADEFQAISQRCVIYHDKYWLEKSCKHWKYDPVTRIEYCSDSIIESEE